MRRRRRRLPNAGDLEQLDALLASDRVADMLKLRLCDMRAALKRGRLAEADRRLLRILHRKAVIDGRDRRSRDAFPAQI